MVAHPGHLVAEVCHVYSSVGRALEFLSGGSGFKSRSWHLPLDFRIAISLIQICLSEHYSARCTTPQKYFWKFMLVHPGYLVAKVCHLYIIKSFWKNFYLTELRYLIANLRCFFSIRHPYIICKIAEIWVISGF